MRVKKEITKFCDKLSIKASILVEFNMEKYNLNYKPHIYKSDIDFYEYPSKNAKRNLFLVTTELMKNLAKCVTSK